MTEIEYSLKSGYTENDWPVIAEFGVIWCKTAKEAQECAAATGGHVARQIPIQNTPQEESVL